jgi:predicted O-methyltransferase YrrM
MLMMGCLHIIKWEIEHFSKYIKKRLSDKNILIPYIAGDCIELLKRLLNNSIDMTFGDSLFSLRKKIR